MASELRETIPTFGEADSGEQGADLTNWSALTGASVAKSGAEIAGLILVAVLIIGGLEFAVRISMSRRMFSPNRAIFSRRCGMTLMRSGHT